jgi:hypothetical protein
MPAIGRGLKNIRTLSSRVDCSSLPYRGYMQITSLEMEKARRGAERASAARRIAEIDERLREIEKEKQQLLAAVTGTAARAPGRLPGLEVKSSGRVRASGFRIRY